MSPNVVTCVYAIALLFALFDHSASQPVLTHRGFMLDTARCFFPKSRIKLMLDMMKNASMNVFHWHMTDNEGFRIQWNRDNGALSSHYVPDIYSHAEIKEIIDYAQARGIDVIPEIDSPAHVYPFSLEYPECMLQGEPDNFELSTSPDVNDLRWDLFHEIYPNFTSKYVHFGHDEIGNRATEVQKSLDFVQTVAQSLHRRPIIWNDPITRQGLAVSRNFTIQAWKGDAASMQSILSAGYQTIISDWNYWYVGSGGSGPNGWYTYPASSYVFPTHNTSSIIGAELCWWTEEADNGNQDLAWLHDAMMIAGKTMWCYKNPSCNPAVSPAPSPPPMPPSATPAPRPVKSTTRKTKSSSPPQAVSPAPSIPPTSATAAPTPHRTRSTTHAIRVAPTPKSVPPTMSPASSHPPAPPSTAPTSRSIKLTTHTARISPTPSAKPPTISPAPSRRPPTSPSKAATRYRLKTTTHTAAAPTPIQHAVSPTISPKPMHSVFPPSNQPTHYRAKTPTRRATVPPATHPMSPSSVATFRTSESSVPSRGALPPVPTVPQVPLWRTTPSTRSATGSSTKFRLVKPGTLTRRLLMTTSKSGHRNFRSTISGARPGNAISDASMTVSGTVVTFLAISAITASVVAIIAVCYACWCAPIRHQKLHANIPRMGANPQHRGEPMF